MNEYILALLGGGLIGIAATILLFTYGRVLGVSGILGGMLVRSWTRETWRIFFVLGIISGGFVASQFFPQNFFVESSPKVFNLILAGLLVGFGTQVGSGCTSGHGVCGMSRISKRSIVATLVFISAGITTVLIMRSMGVSHA